MFLACGSWCAHLGSSPLFHRCRTVLAFIKSIKPTACRSPVEIRGNLARQAPRRFHSNTSVFHNPYHNYKDFSRFLRTIRLVVVMSAVELWKALQRLLSQGHSANGPRWRIVGIGENALPRLVRSIKTKYLPPSSTEFPCFLQRLFTRVLYVFAETPHINQRYSRSATVILRDRLRFGAKSCCELMGQSYYRALLAFTMVTAAYPSAA